MSRRVHRRALLKGASAAAAGLVTGSAAEARAAQGPSGPSLKRDPRGMLDLPPGFRYRILDRRFRTMDDGYRVPDRPDAMACFQGGPGELVLMRNHEVFEGSLAQGPYPEGMAAPAQAFDPEAGGGVTRLVLDAASGGVKRSNLALAGTYWNCAGGISPWGWLSCEETNTPGHGWVFLCPSDNEGLNDPKPIKGYGRYRHEAATVDPRTHIAYLTEDRPDGVFYRFVPHHKELPFEGQLQALAIVDAPRFDTAAMQTGMSLPVRWVDVEHTDSPRDDLRYRALEAGAARVARGEGSWLGEDELLLNATAGGPLGRGQVLRLRLRPQERLEVLAQTDDISQLDMPDNITISPRGQVFVCEDGMGQNHIRRVHPDGRVTAFARNVHSRSELAGACFSPDGRRMFVNMQGDGLTFMIEGPFGEVQRSAAPARQGLPPGVLGLGGGLALIALAALSRRLR